MNLRNSGTKGNEEIEIYEEDKDAIIRDLWVLVCIVMVYSVYVMHN